MKAFVLLFLLCKIQNVLISATTCSDLGLISGGHPTVVSISSFSGNSPQTSKIVWETTGTVDTALTSNITCKEDGQNLVISSAGIPAHKVGKFPMSSSTTGRGHPDNPNTIQRQSYSWKIPKNPMKKTVMPLSIVSDNRALPMGPVAFALNGVPFFNLYNNKREDAVSRNSSGFEVMDLCHGHPNERGGYHYHFQKETDGCLFGVSGAQINVTGGRSPKIGYAFDGIAIYGPIGEGGQVPTDLDACNGRYDTELKQYIYHTTDFKMPYVIGCYRYQPIASTVCRPLRNCNVRCPNGRLKDSNGCTQCRCAPESTTSMTMTTMTTSVICGPVCGIYCQYGNVLDKYGCPTCSCNTAPPSTPTCGPVCEIHCPNGRVYDSNGCQTCECLSAPTDPSSLCPLPHCRLSCPFGYATDSKGCQTCDCISAPTSLCPLPRCLDHCQYGYATDSKGCQTCDCISEPMCIYGGRKYHGGAQFPSISSCNDCICKLKGNVLCTTRPCSSAQCVYDGVRVDAKKFPAADGCNNCTCSKNGVSCETKKCRTKYVYGKVKFNGSVIPADSSNNTFRESFRLQLARLMNISPAQITVLGLHTGSIIVTFAVVGREPSTISQQLTLLVQQRQLRIAYNEHYMIANNSDFLVKQSVGTLGSDDDGDNTSSNTAIIVGGVVGGLVVVTLIILAAAWMVWSRKKWAASSSDVTSYSQMRQKDEKVPA